MQPVSLRRRIHTALSGSKGEPPSLWLSTLITACVLLATAITILHSVPELRPLLTGAESTILPVCGFVFALEFFLRIWAATDSEKFGHTFPVFGRRGAYLVSFLGIVDGLVCLPLGSLLLGYPASGWMSLLTVISLFKLSRYVVALELVGSVIRNERQTLMASVLTLGLLLVVISTSLFLIERQAQPDLFRSIPHTMWWGIVTLTTVGYGDIVPVTLLGRILGGMTMLIGIGMLAMPTGIIASGFANERHRRELLETWKTVSRLPLFQGLDASRIADISGLLRTQIIPAHVIVIAKGEFSNSLFFIVDGEVQVDVSPEPIRLKSGNFFGEAGLIQNKPRSATVTTVKTSRFLVLGLAEFQSLMARAPDIREKIESIASQRNRGNG
jgi:voltage-gated potassium channel